MRLAELENEQALDALAAIIEPAARVLADEEIKAIYDSGKPRIILVSAILKTHKPEVVEILAALNGETPETYRFNLLSLTRDLLDLINDEDVAAVFRSAGQKKSGNASGSAMESTEGDEI